MIVGFVPSLYLESAYHPIFQSIFQMGIVCFFFAYFLYAVKCWGAQHQIMALLMITFPLLAYFLATSKIPDSTTNILFYLFVQFCFYAILSAILLYMSNRVRAGISKYILKKSWRPDRYFYPHVSYAVIGMILVSFFVVGIGSVALLSDNANAITQSFQKINAQSTIIPSSIATAAPTLSSTPSQTYSSTPIPTTPNLNFKQSPKTTSFSYLINGNRESISFTTYGGLADYFSEKSHSYYSDADKEVILPLLENDYQNDNLQPLIDAIRKKANSPDDQAKIAISLVQHIPYNWNKFYGTSMDWYYPYETLHNNKGVCADKSLLLAYLLNKLGYDTVLFEFSNHMAVGVKSSPNYDFYDTGYAFIETTRPTLITYIPDTYYGGFTISSNPHIIHLNGGEQVLDVSTEYRDATEMKQLEAMGDVLDQSHYAEWLRISNYYDTQYDT
jgi:hypothetical protein